MKGFELLFQINLFHQYYDKGVMKDIQIMPDSKTKEWMDRYRLLMRKGPGRFSLYYSAKFEEVSFFQSLSNTMGDLPFVFYMISDNPYFDVISDLPVSWCGQLTFSSRKTKKEADQSIVLEMQLGPQKTWKAGVTGTVSIYPDDLFAMTGNLKKREYSIKMKARSTHWFYYVLNRSRLKLIRPAITNQRGIEFNDAKKVTLTNGEEALRFTSGEEKFLFQETPKIKMDLVNYPETKNKNANGTNALKARTLIKGLPVPGTSQLGVQEREGKQFEYSEIYVYL